MVVLPDADLEMTADAAVASGYGSAGERCMAQTLAHRRRRHGRQAAADDARADRQPQDRPGHGARRRHGPDLHPASTAQSIIKWIDRGVEEGAELVVDGRPFVHPEHPDGFYLGVTLFDHVKPGMDIYNEEIFGPVLGHGSRGHV